MRATFILFIGAIALSACSPSEEAQTGDGLRSDIPLRNVEYFMKNGAKAEIRIDPKTGEAVR